MIIVILAVSEPSIQQIAQLLPDTLAEENWRYLLIAQWLPGVVDFLLLLLPIIVTAMLAFAVKFDQGNSWVLLRGNSEAIKREIFLYRSRVKPYTKNRNAVLAERVKHISERIKSSAVHEIAMRPYEWESEGRVEQGWILSLCQWVWEACDRGVQRLWDALFKLKIEAGTSKLLAAPPTLEGLSQQEDKYKHQKKYADLDVGLYLYFRLENQFDWYRKQCKKYDRQHQVVRFGMYGFAGLGTLFAATNLYSLIPISAAVSTALVNFLEYRRVEATLVDYNQAADALYDIHIWWRSLSDAARNQPKNFAKLVLNVEETIQIENNSWLQDMQERLSGLYGDVENANASSEAEDKLNREPHSFT